MPPATASAATRGDTWLSLGPASRLLGVDPDTLRRWADAGKVRSFATPGGHRRFSRADLERVAAARRSGRPSLAALGATPERFTQAYARSYRSGSAAPAASSVDAQDRAAFRTEGRRLVETLVAYLDATDAMSRAALEHQAVEAIDQTARRLGATRMDPAAATAAFISARAPFLSALESLGRRRSLDAPAVMVLYADASGLLDRLLLRFVTTFHASSPNLQPRGAR